MKLQNTPNNDSLTLTLTSEEYAILDQIASEENTEFKWVLHDIIVFLLERLKT